jgi:hypothetical protein
MKIERSTNGSSWSTLGDDAAGSFISQFAPRLQRNAQVDPLFRADAPQTADRKNDTWNVSITVEQEYSTAAAALTASLGEPAALAGVRYLKVTEGASVWTYSGCVLTGFQPVLAGRSAVFSYSFVATSPTSAS